MNQPRIDDEVLLRVMRDPLALLTVMMNGKDMGKDHWVVEDTIFPNLKQITFDDGMQIPFWMPSEEK